MVRVSTAATLVTGAFALQQPASKQKALDADDAIGFVQKHEDQAAGLCGERVLDWALCDEDKYSLQTVDNLGGKGPDPPPADAEMRFSNVAKIAEVGYLDLVITNITEWDSVNLTKGHGRSTKNPCMAGINIKSKTKTTLNFMLAKSGTSQPLRGGPFDIPFTILDVDSQNEDNQEYVLFDDWRAADKYYYEPNGVERVDVKPRDGTLEVRSADGSLGVGKLGDNPGGRSVDLGPEQLERAVELRFADRNVAQWQATIGTIKGAKGRHFFFAGGSNIPGATHTTTLCACQEWPDSTFDWRLCGDDINGNPVVTNNLGGQGPEKNDKKEIRYGGVASLGGTKLDLVVTAKNTYKAHNVSRNTVITDRVNASIHKCYGAINVANAQSVQLQFQFVNTGTDTPASIGSADSFAFTVYDLDSFAGGAGEAVTFLDMPSDSHTGDDVAISMQNGNFAVCSTVEGTGSDNPLEEKDAKDSLQSSRAVSVKYVGTATFSVELQAIAHDGGNGGRNFLFQGCRMPGKWLEWPEAPYGQKRE